VYSDSGNNFTDYAEGQTWLVSPTTGSPQHSIPGQAAIAHYEFTTKVGTIDITATATDANGNTSEFSLADADGDGLADPWEANQGIDLHGKGDGTFDVSLPDADV